MIVEPKSTSVDRLCSKVMHERTSNCSGDDLQETVNDKIEIVRYDSQVIRSFALSIITNQNSKLNLIHAYEIYIKQHSRQHLDNCSEPTSQQLLVGSWYLKTITPLVGTILVVLRSGCFIIESPARIK